MHRYLAGSLFVIFITLSALRPQSPVLDKAAPGVGKPRLDRNGDPLPLDVVDRLGTARGFDVLCVAVSPDGKTIASGGQDGKIRLWDKATGKEIKHFDLEDYQVNALAFAPDGKTLVFARSGNLKISDSGLVDLQSGKIVVSQKAAHSMCFTPEGKSIAWDNRSISILNVPDGSVSQTFKLRRHGKKQPSILDVMASADGKTLVIHSNKLVLWDMAAKKEIRRWVMDGPRMALSPDGRTLIAYGDGVSNGPRLWDTTTGKESGLLEGDPQKVEAVAFAPDGKWIATAGEDRLIRLWDTVSHKEKHCFGQHHGSFRVLAFSPDGKTLVSAGSKIQVWDVATQKNLLPTPGHQDGLTAIALSPDGKTLASTGYDATIRIWDLATGTERRRVDVDLPVGHYPNPCAISYDGRTLAWYDDKTIYLADLATGRNQRQVDWKATKRVGFLTDGRFLASEGDEWRNPVNGKIIRTIVAKDREWIRAFSADGSILATSAWPDARIPQRGVVLWETATGKELACLQPTANVQFMAFNPDGSLLVTSSPNESPRLWDVRTGKEIRQFEGGEIWICQVAFAPDGQTVAGTNIDGSIHLWETATGRERYHFDGHRAGLTNVLFTPDGRRLISGCGDTTILLWDVSGMTSVPEQQRRAVDAAQWDNLWAALAGEDAHKAHLAIWKMTTARQTVPQLGGRLHPVSAKDIERAAKLVPQLDSDDFAERQKAQKELEAYKDIAEPAMLRALANKPSLEVRARINEILEHIKDPSPEQLRTLRAIEVLEQIGTDEAKTILQSLATGPSEVRVTRMAKAAVERLGKR